MPFSLVLLAAAFASAAAGGGGPAAEFGDDITFSSATSVADVTAEVKASGKPGLVFVTQTWCGACKSLKKSVNDDDEIKEMFGNFIVAHAAGTDGTEWQAEGKSDGYVPRVYFLAPDGSIADVSAPNPKYAHFFSSAAAVKAGMRSVQGAASGNTEL